VIPICTPDLRGNEARYLQECVESTFVSSIGPFVTRFESELADATGSGRAVAVSSGTTALHAALTACGVGRDDLVILPSFTFIASANAIAHCGAVPWLLDIDPDSWTLDSRLLARTLAAEAEHTNGAVHHRSSGRRIAALLPVYTLGTPADMDTMSEIAREWSLPVVADAAAAIGATYKGRSIGRLGATLSCLSFNGNKTVTAGGGGAVIGDDGALTDLVRHLTTTARVGRDYDHDRVGFNYRMTNLSAAVGCAQLERAAEMVAAKRRIADRYDAALAGRHGLASFPRPDWADGSRWFSGIVAEDAVTAEALRSYLAANDIEARSFWKPMHLQRPFMASPQTPQPMADSLWRRIVTLPCSSHLTEAEQEHVIAAIGEFFGGDRR